MKAYDVMKKDGQWKVVEEGSERALRNFSTKAEAVRFGRDYVQSRGGMLRIWKADGVSMQEELSYEVERDTDSVATRTRETVESAGPESQGLLDSITRGAADAAETAGRLIPRVGGYLSRGLYSTAYYSAYGVVFGAVTLGRAIPLPKSLVRGMHDGTEAAIDAYEKGHQVAAQEPATH